MVSFIYVLVSWIGLLWCWRVLIFRNCDTFRKKYWLVTKTHLLGILVRLLLRYLECLWAWLKLLCQEKHCVWLEGKLDGFLFDSWNKLAAQENWNTPILWDEGKLVYFKLPAQLWHLLLYRFLGGDLKVFWLRYVSI